MTNELVRSGVRRMILVRSKGVVMGKNNNLTHDLMLNLVTSQINLARAFLAVARSAYGRDNPEGGDEARTRAERFTSEAMRLAHELSEEERTQLATDLRNLRTNIEDLSRKVVRSPALKFRVQSGE